MSRKEQSLGSSFVVSVSKTNSNAPEYDATSLQAKMDKPTQIIIGSGFGRTGTSSLKAGLSVLGYKTYHMREVYEKDNGDHAKIWNFLYGEKIKLMKSKNITAFSDWDQIVLDMNKYGKYFKQLFDDPGYTATCDFPSALFYMEQMEYYKQKGMTYKVVLTVRDSGQVWAKSYYDTIGKFPEIMDTWNWRIIPGSMDSINLAGNIYGLPFGDRKNDRDYVISRYNEWIESVKKFVDEDKLLIFNVKQGWTPLTDFLELEIPKEYADKPDEFIRTNDSKEIKKGLDGIVRVNRIANIGLGLVVTGIIAACGYAYKKSKK